MLIKRLNKNKISSFIYFLSGIVLLIYFSGCKKTEDAAKIKETGTLTDIDNNVYKTIKIGNQWWMAEDLKVKRYSDGTFINQIQFDSAQWRNDTSGAYCNNIDNAQKIIGVFYNGYAVSNKESLAPEGWHIPTDVEWKELEKYLGMSQQDADKSGWRGKHEGEKLKIESRVSWRDYGDVWSTNESGFTALAVGCRIFNGGWGDPGISSTCFWWSSTRRADNDLFYRYLDYKNSNVFRSHSIKNYGFSVRCVKN